ncbi:MAG: IS110 family transposase [Gemmatimonadetes bacterium]|nr:IS110 family transposase [Gemmatimonadota bacterium]
MEQYVGLDVSLKETSICVVDGSGEIVYETSVGTTPETIAKFIEKRAPGAVRVGLESGLLSTWLWHGLRALDVPVVCLDARHAASALKMQVNKTDRNDAAGLAQIVRTGWYREVEVKSLACHEVRAVLLARSRLVASRRDLENQMRGLLKPFGLLVGKVRGKGFEGRVRELIADTPAMAEVIDALLLARRTLCTQVARLDVRVRMLAQTIAPCRRLMTVPGVGPITALAYVTVIDDPGRFRKGRSVGAYLGLTPRRYQSGEVDRAGRISKCGDGLVRTLLFEAAGVLLTRVQRMSPLKAWGLRLAKRIGAKKAKVAVARKLAVILHCMWTDGTEFWWTKEEAAA